MTSPSPASTRKGAPSRSGRAIVAAIALVLTVVVVIGVVIAVRAYRDVNSANQLDANRRQAVLVAEQFALRMDDFAAPSVSAYKSRVEQVLSTKAKADFAQVAPVIGQVFQAAQPKSSGLKAPTGKIVYAGVSDIDSDSATVLVAHDSTASTNANSLHFRWTVSLVKVNGTWLVDGLPPEIKGGGSQ